MCLLPVVLLGDLHQWLSDSLLPPIRSLITLRNGVRRAAHHPIWDRCCIRKRTMDSVHHSTFRCSGLQVCNRYPLHSMLKDLPFRKVGGKWRKQRTMEGGNRQTNNEWKRKGIGRRQNELLHQYANVIINLTLMIK